MISGNNPGNIRCNPANNWQGQIGCNNGFVVFDSLFYGFRAMLKILINDINAGDDTINALIYQYAPPHENNTEAYINNVVNWSGVARYQSLKNDPAGIMAVCAAMVRMETGQIINPALLVDPYIAAGGDIQTPADDRKSFPIIPAALLAYLLS